MRPPQQSDGETREARMERRKLAPNPNHSSTPLTSTSASVVTPLASVEATGMPVAPTNKRNREERNRPQKNTTNGKGVGMRKAGTGGTTGNIPTDLVLTAGEQADKEGRLKEVLAKRVWSEKPLQLPFIPEGNKDGMVRWPEASRSISTTCGVDALRSCSVSTMRTNTARMLAEVPGSGKEGVTPGELLKLVREDIVLETISCPSPSCVFDRTLGEGLLILLLERKKTKDYHWCVFLPGVGFWDRKGRGAKTPVEVGVDAWLDALGYIPIVHHAYTPVVRLWVTNVMTGRPEKRKGGYIPCSLLQYGKGKKGIHVSASRLPRAAPTPPNLQLKVGQRGALNYNGILYKVIIGHSMMTQLFQPLYLFLAMESRIGVGERSDF